MWKKVLIGCAIAGILVVLGISAALYIAVRRLAPSTHGPKSVSKPAVLIGSGLMSKSVFARATGIGKVTDIICSKPGQIIAAGPSGAAVVDTISGAVKSSVSLTGSLDNVTIVSTPSGSSQYLNRGSWISAAALYDGSGKVLWTYGGLSGVDDAAAGDINGDGRLEFVVGYNGGGGVHLLDSSGRKVWVKSDGNVWHVEMVDTNGDGKLEIVHSNAGGQMTVRDAAGAVLRQSRPPTYFSHFSLCRWPGKAGSQYALQAGNDAIWVLAFDGRAAARLDAPKCGYLGAAKGVPVRLENGKPDLFAVLVSFSNRDTSSLYVYGPDRKLVYQEVLPGECSAITALAAGGSRPESLLVGGSDVILRYTMVPAATAK